MLFFCISCISLGHVIFTSVRSVEFRSVVCARPAPTACFVSYVTSVRNFRVCFVCLFVLFFFFFVFFSHWPSFISSVVVINFIFTLHLLIYFKCRFTSVSSCSNKKMVSRLNGLISSACASVPAFNQNFQLPI